MKGNTITVAAAVKRYYWQVLLPFFVLFFGGMIVAAFIIIKLPAIGAILMAASFIGSIVICLISYSHWVVWAFLNVDQPKLLYNRAVRTNLMMPKESFWTKLNITATVNKDDWRRAFERMDEAVDVRGIAASLPTDGVVEVKYANNAIAINIIVAVAFCALLIGLFVSGGMEEGKGRLLYFLGPAAMIYFVYEAIKGIRNQGKTAMVFSLENLWFFGEQVEWADIRVFSVNRDGKSSFNISITGQLPNTPEGRPGKIFNHQKGVNGLDATPDRIEELMTAYRELTARR